MFSLSQEALIFIHSVLCGVTIMVIYDFFAVTRRSCVSVLVCNICDSVFVLASSLVMIFMLFSVSNGYVRAYEFIGAFLGGAIYKITISRYLSALFVKIIGIILVIFAKIFKFLLTPLEFMYKIICSIIGVLCSGMRKILTPAVRSIKKLLHTIGLTLKKT